jgi:hypothetical protein
MLIKKVIYKEVLKGFYYIKVLKVFKTIPNRLSDISVGNIKKSSKYFIYIY